MKNSERWMNVSIEGTEGNMNIKAWVDEEATDWEKMKEFEIAFSEKFHESIYGNSIFGEPISIQLEDGTDLWGDDEDWGQEEAYDNWLEEVRANH